MWSWSASTQVWGERRGGGKGGGGKNRRWKFELQLAAGSEDVAQEKKTEGFLFTFTFRDLFLPLVFCPDALFMNSCPNFARCTFNDRGKRVESEVKEAKVKVKLSGESESKYLK